MLIISSSFSPNKLSPLLCGNIRVSGVKNISSSNSPEESALVERMFWCVSFIGITGQCLSFTVLSCENISSSSSSSSSGNNPPSSLVVVDLVLVIVDLVLVLVVHFVDDLLSYLNNSSSESYNKNN